MLVVSASALLVGQVPTVPLQNRLVTLLARMVAYAQMVLVSVHMGMLAQIVLLNPVMMARSKHSVTGSFCHLPSQ